MTSCIFVVRIHLHGDFELFFTLVEPVLLIEKHRLKIVPFRAAFVERVEFVLRGGKVSALYRFFDVFIKPAVGLDRKRLFLTERRDFLIGGFEFGEFPCRLVAFFTFRKSFFAVFRFEFGIFRG